MISVHLKTSAAALLLAASLLFSGCGTTVDTASQTDDFTDQETGTQLPTESITVIDCSEQYKKAAASYLAALPEADFENESFLIAAPRTDVLRPEESSTVYSAAKYERNQQIEERYNIHLIASAVPEADYAETVRLSVQADEYFADLLMLPQYSIGAFVANNLLLNINSMPLFYKDMPFFDKTSAEAASIGNQTYAIAGPASFEESLQTVMFFNRDLFTENALPLPYDDVYAGTWTWDRFFEICASVSAINATAETPYASYAMQYTTDTLPASVCYACDEKMIRKESSLPTLAFGETTERVLSVLRALYGETNAHTDADSGINRFYTGQSLFLLDRLYVMTWMTNGKENWGILPLPKADAAQSGYVTLASPDTLFFGVQRNTSDVMRTSVILSALNAASYGVISDAYLNDALHTTLRDNDSANMLEILTNGRTYDFAYSFGWTDSTLAGATFAGLKRFALGEEFPIQAQTDAVNGHLSAAYPVG